MQKTMRRFSVSAESCAETDDALRLAADASILLTYHKFQDDLADERARNARLRRCCAASAAAGYEKARARMPKRMRTSGRRSRICAVWRRNAARPWTVRRIRPRA